MKIIILMAAFGVTSGAMAADVYTFGNDSQGRKVVKSVDRGEMPSSSYEEDDASESSYSSSDYSSSYSTSTERDRERCNEYQERVQRYRKNGVDGINLATGRISKMSDEQAKEVIEDTESSAEVLCE